MFYFNNRFVLLLNYLRFRITIWNCSRRYCRYLSHIGSIFSLVPPENIKITWFPDVSRGYKKLTLTSTGSILVLYRNYNVFQSFCFKNYWLGKWSYMAIYLRFGILSSIFSIPNWYFSFFNSTIRGNLGRDGVEGSGGGWGGGGNTQFH